MKQLVARPWLIDLSEIKKRMEEVIPFISKVS
jgi:hypothetical protein